MLATYNMQNKSFLEFFKHRDRIILEVAFYFKQAFESFFFFRILKKN